MSFSLLQRLAAELAQRAAAGTRRHLPAPPAPGLVDFSSNDYLGLSRHPRVRAAVQAAAQLPAGSTGSRLLTGNSAAAEALETHLAQFHRAEAALLFNSGYAANLGFFGAVPRRGDTIFYDAAIHASVKDGIRASFATAYRFRHHDLADLRRQLPRATGAVFVAVESLYSMDGDLAPLPALAALCREAGLHLVVDEAHSNGLYGPRGEGLVAALGLEEAVFARIITFRQSPGQPGRRRGRPRRAARLPAQLQPALHLHHRPAARGRGRPHRRLPPAARPGRRAGAALRLVGLPASPPQRRARPARAPGKPGYPPRFLSLQSPGPARVRALAAAAQAAGFDVRPIVAPTVPAGTERLRVIVHSYNTEAEIDGLAGVLK